MKKIICSYKIEYEQKWFVRKLFHFQLCLKVIFGVSKEHLFVNCCYYLIRVTSFPIPLSYFPKVLAKFILFGIKMKINYENNNAKISFPIVYL